MQKLWERLWLFLCCSLGATAFVIPHDLPHVPKNYASKSLVAASESSIMGSEIGPTLKTQRGDEESSSEVEQHLKQTQVDELELETMDTVQIKQKLLELLPRMTGTEEEFKIVESYVNTLEERYVPVQTLEFLNFAMTGDWQLLFSTNLSGGLRRNFRLRELFQRIEAKGLKGTITNEATWDLAEHTSSIFDATGTFSVQCTYKINQGARMITDLQEHILQPSRGSKIPQDIPSLVGLLHRAMPKELFDPSEHAMDTTYLDGDLRIVRMTGPRFEGVRDIFIRRGSMEIHPTGKDV